MKHRKNRQSERSDSADAFVPDPDGGHGPVSDELAEYLGESFLSTATGGEDGGEALQEDIVTEELGGPFLETDGGEEFGASRRASAADEPGAPEAFPTAVRGGRPSGLGRRS